MGFFGKLAAGLAGLLSENAGGVVGYHAGRSSRADRDFMPTGMGPNALADETLDLARRRVGYLVDNDPIIGGAKNLMRNNIVGVVPEPATPSDEVNTELAEKWHEFARGVDPERRLSLVESQQLFFDEHFRVGEVMRHDVIVPAFNGRPAGPAVELISGERIPLDMDRAPRNGAARVRQGIELDENDRRVAVYVLPKHPNDGCLDAFYTSAAYDQAIRVPIEQAELCFRQHRLGQMRGVPWPVNVVTTKRLEEQYTEAYLLLAKAAACVSLFFHGGDGRRIVSGSAVHSAEEAALADGSPIKKMFPAMVGFLKKGVEPKLLQANLPPPTMPATIEIMLRRVSAGMGVSYAAVARDYSKSTFSATRAEQLEDRKAYYPAQAFVWEHHTAPLYRRWVLFMILTGQVKAMKADLLGKFSEDPTPWCKAEPIYPGWEWINPSDEASAAELELAIGTASPQILCASKGRRFIDVLRQTLKAEKLEQDLRAEMKLGPKQPKTIKDKPAKKEEEKAPADDKSKEAA